MRTFYHFTLIFLYAFQFISLTVSVEQVTERVPPYITRLQEKKIFIVEEGRSVEVNFTAALQAVEKEVDQIISSCANGKEGVFKDPLCTFTQLRAIQENNSITAKELGPFEISKVSYRSKNRVYQLGPEDVLKIRLKFELIKYLVFNEKDGAEEHLKPLVIAPINAEIKKNSIRYKKFAAWSILLFSLARLSFKLYGMEGRFCWQVYALTQLGGFAAVFALVFGCMTVPRLKKEKKSLETALKSLCTKNIFQFTCS